MPLSMPRPMKRSGSSVHHLIQRIPADVLAKARGRRLAVPVGDETAALTLSERAVDVRVSLRTRDPAEARARQTKALAYLQGVWQALRAASPVSLTQRQATALAGRFYRAWVDGEGRERTVAVVHDPARGWLPDRVTAEEDEAHFASAVAHIASLAERDDPAALGAAFRPLVDRILFAEGIASVDPESVPLLLGAFRLAAQDAFERRQREAGGDYSPDPKAERFPAWVAPQAKPKAVQARTTLTGLLADWWAERKAAGLKPSTHESYSNTVTAFVAFLTHDDAARVTPDDVIGFKDHRLATLNPRSGKTLSAKTVKDSDLAGLKAIFAWAVTNRRLPSNPAKDVTLKLGKVRKVRGKGFTDAEAATILRAALAYSNEAERPQTASAKRWVPWLSAYTGARVGELAQLRKQDLRREGPHWVITITPEAGTVKTNEAREVPLHAHLVELGFPAFVQGAPAGHLFLRPAADGDVLGPLQGVKNRLSEFGRSLVADPNVAPNHGWRHRFKTKGREAGMDWRVLDAIQGHAPRTEGESYGEVSVKAMAGELAKLRRVDFPS